MTDDCCAYGVPRTQCRVGCGRTCRRLNDPRTVAEKLAVSPVFQAALVMQLPCCGDCDKPAGHTPCSVGYIGSDRPPGVGPDHA